VVERTPAVDSPSGLTGCCTAGGQSPGRRRDLGCGLILMRWRPAGGSRYSLTVKARLRYASCAMIALRGSATPSAGVAGGGPRTRSVPGGERGAFRPPRGGLGDRMSVLNEALEFLGLTTGSNARYGPA
jgi:hypothetical protein